MRSAPLQHSDCQPFFWRDPQLPFIEARSVADGRQLCYARHSHEVFSIGAITAGCSTYLHEKTAMTVQTGTVVLMNPGQVHACNPIHDQPWSYLMLYVDPQWLADIQHDAGLDTRIGFIALPPTHSHDPVLFEGLCQLYTTLIDAQATVLHKQCTALQFFTRMQAKLGTAAELTRDAPDKTRRLERAAEFIDAHFADSIRLEDICKAAHLSPSYLIRAFVQHYHMTPHAYLLNRRIQHVSRQLKQGRLIAELAQESGFADQAHLQREFKKHLAATPGQYRL